MPAVTTDPAYAAVDHSAGTTPTTSSSGLDLVDWDPDNKTRNVVIGSVLLLVNLLTLVTVIRTPSLRLHTKLLVGSLTCTDTLMGVITLLPRLLPWHHLSHEPLCPVRFACILIAVYGSCLSITTITVDRALALTVPIAYRNSVTVGKTLAAVGAVWATSLMLTAASLARGFQPGRFCDLLLVMDTHGLLLMGYVLMGCVLLIGAMYGYIGYRLWRRRRRVRTELHVAVVSSLRTPAAAGPGGAGGGGGGGGDGGVLTDGAGGHSQASSMKSERRTTVTAVLLAVCFLVGYLPVAVYILWVVHSGLDRLQEARTQRLLIVVACPLSNCILDPIIYFWRLQNRHSGIFGKCRNLVLKSEGRDSSKGGVAQMSQRTTA